MINIQHTKLKTREGLLVSMVKLKWILQLGQKCSYSVLLYMALECKDTKLCLSTWVLLNFYFLSPGALLGILFNGVCQGFITCLKLVQEEQDIEQ
jgi:hypothetical protein